MILAPLLASLAFPSTEMAEDSGRATLFWGYLQAGDTTAAQGVLTDTSLRASPNWDKLANFLSAYVAYSDSTFSTVPTLLDLGTTDELTEHAYWLRAMALKDLGQPHLAGIYWRKLVDSDLEDYREIAVEELFADVQTQSSLDTLQTLSTIARERGVSRELRQRIDFELAGFLSLAGRHTEATEILRTVYLLSPGTGTGQDAKESLKTYAVRYGFSPTQPDWSGEWEEVERLEKTGQKAGAFNKIEELRKRGRYAANDEMMIARQVRLAIALRRHGDAKRLAEQHLKQFPNSSYRDEMLFSLTRAAYLMDEDDLAIRTAETLARTGTDKKQIGETWRLIGLLHIDRERPAEAAIAFDKWVKAAAGGDGADDALWNRGWARFLSGQYAQAAGDFVLLVKSYPKSGYVPIGLYWGSRAYDEAGNSKKSDSLCFELQHTMPFSYYSQLQCGMSPQPDPERLDYEVLSLDQLAAIGGRHTRAFAQLTAMGLWELALREWPKVEDECGQRADVAWWRPLLYWKSGQRFESWRWIIRELRDEVVSDGNRPLDFFKLWYPLDYEPLILDLCGKYHVDPYLALGVICQESHFDEKIVSPSGAIGLMQLMPATAREQARKIGQSLRTDDLYYGPRNLEIGIAHLAELMNDLGGDTVLTLCAYNAGINAARRWKNEFGTADEDVFVERIPYRETRLYVKYIMQHMAAYRRLYPNLKLSLPGNEP
ncbi:MAG: transglycosylase SLT domain-containing protein [Calditrichaeota bacterium]|nr:transglycosylase SLT domain-containing protein [Calditrichota bacterium]MCB9367973.1 transglycosylase SLT domain-containing protein [Calditrichota bacterium]